MWDFILRCVDYLSGFALGKFLPAVVIFVVGVLVIKILMRIIVSALKKAKVEQPALGLIRGVLRAVMYILLALIGASALGLDVTGVVAFASVLTLALSLSLQESLTNLIGGFTLLYTKPFSIGDFVEIAGQSGAVRAIGLNYTKMTTTDNKTISIPNHNVVTAEIINYTVAGTRRTDITVSVSYDTPIPVVLEALKEAANVPTALADPAPSAVVSDYGQDAVVYLLQAWSKSGDYWATTCQTKENIQKVFNEKGIRLSYHTMNVTVKKGE